MASATLSMVIFSSLYTSLNHCTYSGIDCNMLTASSWFEAISMGLAMGPFACSFKSFARPSQNCARLNFALRTVGEFIGPSIHLCPIEVGRLSAPPVERLWQELHVIQPDLDNLGSKNNFFPNSIFVLSQSKLIGIGWIGSSPCIDTDPPCILPPLPYPICAGGSSAAVTVSITTLITTSANTQQIAVNLILFTCSPFLVNRIIEASIS